MTKPASLALKEAGAEVVAADLGDRNSVFKAIAGSSVVFGVTNCMCSHALDDRYGC